MGERTDSGHAWRKAVAKDGKWLDRPSYVVKIGLEKAFTCDYEMSVSG